MFVVANIDSFLSQYHQYTYTKSLSIIVTMRYSAMHMVQGVAKLLFSQFLCFIKWTTAGQAMILKHSVCLNGCINGSCRRTLNFFLKQ